MHELSVAMTIIDLASQEAERHEGVVRAVHLRLGAFAGVAKEALLFSYEVAAADTPLAGSALVIEDVPLRVYCDSCGVERELESGHVFVCAVCGGPTPEIRSGREVEVVALELDG